MMFGFGKKKVDKAAWATAVFAEPPKHPEKLKETDLAAITRELIFQNLRIINESIDIVQRTRNEDTRQGRIDLIGKRYTHLQTLEPFADENSRAKILMVEERMRSVGLIDL
jgi:hypothetical protein